MHRGRKVCALCKGQKGAESSRRAVSGEGNKGGRTRQGAGSVGLRFTGQSQESALILRARGSHWRASIRAVM